MRLLRKDSDQFEEQRQSGEDPKTLETPPALGEGAGGGSGFASLTLLPGSQAMCSAPAESELRPLSLQPGAGNWTTQLPRGWKVLGLVVLQSQNSRTPTPACRSPALHSHCVPSLQGEAAVFLLSELHQENQRRGGHVDVSPGSPVAAAEL